MSTPGSPPKGQQSVPPKTPGHDQMPMWKRMTDTSRRFIKRDPQLAPLGAIVLGTVGLFWYFQHTKVRDAAKEAGLPRRSDTKAGGRGGTYRTATGESAPTKGAAAYHLEPDETAHTSPGGLLSYLHPHLDKHDKELLDTITVPHNEGRFGRTMKQAAVLDQRKKDRAFEHKLKQSQGTVAENTSEADAGNIARNEDHLADLQSRKRTM